jgi:hypothetical protein
VCFRQIGLLDRLTGFGCTDVLHVTNGDDQGPGT